MLDNLGNVLKKYYSKRGALAAFNVANIDMVRAVIDAAVAENRPVAVQIFRRLFEDETCEYIAEVVKYAANKADVPIVFHLDHGMEISQLIKAVDLGFTSVMIDGSGLEFDKNIGLVLDAKEAISNLRTGKEISIEAELGGIPSASSLQDEENKLFTDPGQVEEFVNKTNVDAIAISYGSAHGIYLKKPYLDFELLKKIYRKTKIPLVLHGGTGLSEEDIKKSVQFGIKKVNIASELQKYYAEEFKEAETKNGDKFVPLDILTKPIREKLTDLIRYKIRLINGY